MLLRDEFSGNPRGTVRRMEDGKLEEFPGGQALGQSEAAEEDDCSCGHCWKKLDDSFDVEIRAVWFCCLDEQWLEATSHPSGCTRRWWVCLGTDCVTWTGTDLGGGESVSQQGGFLGVDWKLQRRACGMRKQV